MYLTKKFSILINTLILVLACTLAHAQIQPSKLALETPVEAFQMTDEARAATNLKNGTLLTISLNMEPDWYTYANVPGGMGKPTKLFATTANGMKLQIIYPKGKEKPDTFDPSTTINAYENGTRLFILIPTDAPQPYPIKIRLDLLLCHPTKCVPARIDITYEEQGIITEGLPFANIEPWWPGFVALVPKDSTASAITKPVVEYKNVTDIVKWDFTPTYLQPELEVTSLLSAILMGLLAGLILNIMPCVLPVVSLKLSALLPSGGADNKIDREQKFREHNIFFALGAISFFLVLALILGSTGQAWGALFQNQWLVLGIAGIIITLALSLFGLFHLPVVDLKFGTGHDNPRIQAFFTGSLTTLLATPCSGPFLGGVLGWALIQGPLIIATVFISIGIGMATPYLLLALNPSFARFLPKSGPWIEYVEKSIAFFLLATAFYLISIALGDESLRILAPLWTLLIGGWLWIRTRSAKKVSTKWSVRLTVLALIAAGIIWTMPSQPHADPWRAFYPVDLSQRIGKEKLFVNFTADWCPTCKVLEATVLTDENITRWSNEYNVVFIKVDMTKRDPDAEALLKALGSMSIPTAAMFSIGDESHSPLVLRDLYTQSQLENILKSWKK